MGQGLGKSGLKNEPKQLRKLGDIEKNVVLNRSKNLNFADLLARIYQELGDDVVGITPEISLHGSQFPKFKSVPKCEIELDSEVKLDDVVYPIIERREFGGFGITDDNMIQGYAEQRAALEDTKKPLFIKPSIRIIKATTDENGRDKFIHCVVEHYPALAGLEKLTAAQRKDILKIAEGIEPIAREQIAARRNSGYEQQATRLSREAIPGLRDRRDRPITAEDIAKESDTLMNNAIVSSSVADTAVIRPFSTKNLDLGWHAVALNGTSFTGDDTVGTELGTLRQDVKAIILKMARENQHENSKAAMIEEK
jgi:hypothetical protein